LRWNCLSKEVIEKKNRRNVRTDSAMRRKMTLKKRKKKDIGN
jgi:hypothetical protein